MWGFWVGGVVERGRRELLILNPQNINANLNLWASLAFFSSNQASLAIMNFEC